jgi:hypothetical protein
MSTQLQMNARYAETRIENAKGQTMDEVVEEMRQKHWVPLRRALLLEGVTLSRYCDFLNAWRKGITRYITHGWPEFCYIRLQPGSISSLAHPDQGRGLTEVGVVDEVHAGNTANEL